MTAALIKQLAVVAAAVTAAANNSSRRMLTFMRTYCVSKQKFRPVIEEAPQSLEAIHGRGASWSPANRFEKLHVDLTDIDVVDPIAATEERPKRATQYFRDDTKSIIARNNS